MIALTVTLVLIARRPPARAHRRGPRARRHSRARLDRTTAPTVLLPVARARHRAVGASPSRPAPAARGAAGSSDTARSGRRATGADHRAPPARSSAPADRVA